jgi:hypothetical protein
LIPDHCGEQVYQMPASIPDRGRRRVSEPNSTRRAGAISNRGWKRRFDEPIPLPRGGQLVTLQDAGTYITKLPKAEHEAPEWLAAMEAADPGR